jgi:Tfp pilus assembly protein PilF
LAILKYVTLPLVRQRISVSRKSTMRHAGREQTTTTVGALLSWFSTFWAVSVLVLVVLASFLPVRENLFVNYDDRKNILENASFQGFGWPQFSWAWTTGHLGVYQPLGWILLEAEYALWGLSPRGYHLTSLVLYIGVVIAFYALTVTVVERCRPEMGRDDPGIVRACSCLAVALFAAHPLRVEVVAWVSCQSYIPCALFSLLAVLTYLRAHDDGIPIHRGRLIGSFLLFAAALLSKAAALGLPVVLLVLDVYPLGRLGRDRWLTLEARGVYREKVPFAILSAVFGALALWARAQHMTSAGHTWETRVARACYGVWFYLSKTLVPVGISACYPVPLRLTLAAPRFLFCALGLAAATAALVAVRRRMPAVLAAWVVYLVMLTPSSGLVPTGGQYIASDRYCFMPTMSWFVLAASAMCVVVKGRRLPRLVSLGVLAVVLAAVVVLVVRTREQCRTWRDSESLWLHGIAVSTEPNPFAYHSLGLALSADSGRLAEAEQWIAKTVAIVPDDPAARNAMTIVLARQGRIDEALAQNREALRAAPNNVNARVNRGNLLALKKDTAGAQAAYEEALRIDPGNADAHGNLGMILLAKRRSAEAEAHLTEAVRLNPAMGQARRALEDLRRQRDSQGGSHGPPR